jgi:hypothetical protein
MIRTYKAFEDFLILTDDKVVQVIEDLENMVGYWPSPQVKIDHSIFEWYSMPVPFLALCRIEAFRTGNMTAGNWSEWDCCTPDQCARLTLAISRIIRKIRPLEECWNGSPEYSEEGREYILKNAPEDWLIQQAVNEVTTESLFFIDESGNLVQREPRELPEASWDMVVSTLCDYGITMTNETVRKRNSRFNQRVGLWIQNRLACRDSEGYKRWLRD